MKKLGLLLLIVGIAACRKEPTVWNTEIVAPLAKGQINFADILPDSLFYTDDDNLYHLYLEQSLTDLSVDSLLNLEDTVFAQSFTVPFTSGTITLPVGTTIISLSQDFEMGSDDVLLRRVRMKSGYLQYVVSSYINGYLTCQYELPGVSLGNESVSITANTSPGDADNPGEAFGQIDMTGYVFDLTGESGADYNKLFSQITVSVAADAPSPAVVHGQDSVVVSMQFVDPVIDYALGYFGEHTYQLNEDIEFFGGATAPTGILFLERASMDLDFINRIGVDAKIDFDNIQSFTDFTSADLNYSPLSNSVNLTRALDLNGQVFPTEQHYHIDETNSGILNFLGIVPNALHVNANVHINPLGNISGSNDFYYADFPLEAKFRMDVPLKIGAQALTFSDTVNFDFNEEIDVNGFLRLRFSNYFPFSANAKLIAIDSEDGHTHVLLNDGRIEAGSANAEGVVEVPTHSEILVPISSSIIDVLKMSDRMNIRVQFNTPDNPETFPIYNSYKMDFVILVDAAAKIELN
ncbi:MAG: hypothetical protein R2809_07530 [Flavobacteriales bacterium]